ncbi:MAG: hypothetical protein ACR2H5_00415 [Ktedonobacteraceae bacterium]
MVQTMQNPASPQPEAWLPRIIQVRTTITMLDTALIPFVLLKEDPIPVVEHCIETYLQSSTIQSNIQQIAIDAWNKPFAELSCNENFFIYAWSAEHSASPKVTHQAKLSMGIATPGPSYKRWFTTRAVPRQQTLVAWCIEVDMRKAANGEIVSEIVLSEENMICLLSK